MLCWCKGDDCKESVGGQTGRKVANHPESLPSNVVGFNHDICHDISSQKPIPPFLILQIDGMVRPLANASIPLKISSSWFRLTCKRAACIVSRWCPQGAKSETSPAHREIFSPVGQPPGKFIIEHHGSNLTPVMRKAAQNPILPHTMRSSAL